MSGSRRRILRLPTEIHRALESFSQSNMSPRENDCSNNTLAEVLPYAAKLAKYRQQIAVKASRQLNMLGHQRYEDDVTGLGILRRDIGRALFDVGPDLSWLALWLLGKGKARLSDVTIRRELDNCLSRWEPGKAVPYLVCSGDNRESWSQYGLRQVLSSKTIPVERMDVQTIKHIIQLGLSKIWVSSPEIVVRCLLTARALVLARTEEFVSSSIPVTFGAVYMGVSSCKDWLATALALVHESAHHELIVENAVEPLLVNSQQLAPSPLRSDLRPMLAVMHATFVCYRLAGMLAESKANAKNERDRVAAELRAYTDRLEKGVKTLASRGKFTRSGELIFYKMKAFVGAS